MSKTVRFVTNQKIICHRFVTPGWSLYVTIFYSLNNQNWDIFSKYNYLSFKGPTDDRDFKDPTEDRDFEDPTNNRNFKDPRDKNGFESKLKENLLTTVPLESSTSAKKDIIPVTNALMILFGSLGCDPLFYSDLHFCTFCGHVVGSRDYINYKVTKFSDTSLEPFFITPRK